MKPLNIAIVALSALTLSACGSHAVSPAAFCKQFSKADVEMVGLLQGHPSKSNIEKAAKLIQHMADIAPSDIKKPVEAEAAAWQESAKTGSPAALNKSAYSVADAKLTAWVKLHCK